MKTRLLTLSALVSVLCLFPLPSRLCGDGAVEIKLWQSSDLQTWESVPVTPEILAEDGEILLPAAGGSMFFRLTIEMVETPPPVPEGFVLIPAGTYARGDHKNDEPESWMARSRPVHNLYVSAFYMAQTPVTYAQWREVYDWAVANGYGFDNSGTRGWISESGEFPDTPENNLHPVVNINWYDMVKWSNARSEMEGLTPAYYTNDARTVVYKTGRHDVTNAQVRWGATGYRLPTEAEWEKAARGGLHGKRWPWGDEDIDGTRANYWDSRESVGPNGTTPVGSYPANGYGLYDMAGNVWEWIWDWFDADYYGKAGATEPDTSGPSSGSVRVVRGGSWGGGPELCRVAGRSWGQRRGQAEYFGVSEGVGSAKGSG